MDFAVLTGQASAWTNFAVNFMNKTSWGFSFHVSFVSRGLGFHGERTFSGFPSEVTGRGIDRSVFTLLCYQLTWGQPRSEHIKRKILLVLNCKPLWLAWWNLARSHLVLPRRVLLFAVCPFIAPWVIRMPVVASWCSSSSDFESEKWKVLSCVRLFVTPWTIQSIEFSRPEYWSG